MAREGLITPPAVSKKNHPWTSRGGVLALLFGKQMNPKTPPVDGVPVSTTETPVPDWGLPVSTKYGESLSEKACLRYLVKVHGWHWIAAGVLKAPFKQWGE